MRTVILNCRRTYAELDWPMVKEYLGAYKKHVRLTDLECQLAYDAAYRRFVFDLWAIEQWLAHPKTFRNINFRRVALIKNLHDHRQEYAERISGLLSGKRYLEATDEDIELAAVQDFLRGYS